MTTTINADDGVVSGSAGLKYSADSSGVLALQTNGTTAVTVDASQNVTLAGTLTATGVTTVQAGTAALPAITTTGDTNTGIFFPAADTIAFAEGGTEAMRIDSSANVGIGTSSAISTAKTSIKQASGGGAGSTQLHLEQSNSTDGYDLKCDSADGALAFLRYASGSATERARIDASGYVLVNKTSATTYGGIFAQAYTSNTSGQKWLQVWDSTVSAGSCQGLYVTYSAATPNATANEFIFCTDQSAQRFVARSNGGLANYSANNANLSDRREKINFAPAKSYIDVICAIPVQTFNYIDQNIEDDDGLTLGVVAQDVQAVAPELVSESDWSLEKDGSKMRLSIYQTDLQYALMKCIQEQQALITALTARITALETQSADNPPQGEIP
jgi:hypothetical protein